MSDQLHANRLIKHGILVMIIGLICGFGLTFSILGQISLSPIPLVIDYQMPGTTAAWARMHTGCLMNGIMLLAVAALYPRFVLTTRQEAGISKGLVFVAWANVLFYIFGAFSPNRGLALSETPAGGANWASFIAYIPAVIAAVLLLIILARLLMALPSKRDL
ncbi:MULTISPECIES: hypothetical protein [unclassified Ruegeria]|uniref:hypothetical protein n=1 Tax=unclassified Ruegeria TaxID=2625375 RepID=UPI00148918BE|nr:MULTISPECIES: hypothetical protein [unclassified Ruegeria]